jgi:hypothetical protein
MRYLQILIFLCFINLPLFSLQNNFHFSQASNINPGCADGLHEIVYLHLNRNSVVVGERLYFKAYILNKPHSFIIKSNILYIEIIDFNNRIKANIRSNITNGACASSILVPDSLATGLYKIVAYTNLMRNFPLSSYVGKSLIVIGLKNEINSKTDNNEIQKDSLNNNQLGPYSETYIETIKSSSLLEAKLDKNDYKKKEKIALNLNLKGINAKDLKCNLSLSVSERLPGLFSLQNPDISEVSDILINNTGTLHDSVIGKNNELQFAAKNYNNWLEKIKSNSVYSLQYQPENVNFLLEGIIYDKTSKKVAANEKLLLSTSDSLAVLKYAISDSLGRFIFPLDKSFDNKKLFISNNSELGTKEYYFVFDNKLVSDSSISFKNLIFDKALAAYVYKCKEIALINKVYYKPYEQAADINNEKNKNTFYGKPDYTLYMSDYNVEFEDFGDISKNIMPGIKFKKKKDRFVITMTDLNKQITWPENCLVLLNNVPFYDYDFLTTLGSKQIDHIDICYKHIAYGDIDFYGIMSVFTKDKIIISNGQSVIFDNKVEASVFTTIDKTNPNKVSAKQPNFKQALYWNPQLVFDASGNCKLEFFASEMASEYIIDIEGVTSNGFPVAKRLSFKIH